MYFITLKRPGYELFSTTPSGRVAIGLTEKPQRVHVLLLDDGKWSVARDWAVEEHSHTELMLALGKIKSLPILQSSCDFCPRPPTERGLGLARLLC